MFDKCPADVYAAPNLSPEAMMTTGVRVRGKDQPGSVPDGDTEPHAQAWGGCGEGRDDVTAWGGWEARLGTVVLS
jgi:hypothetical protein